MKECYSLQELAKLVNRVPQTIHLHMKQGKVKGFKKGWYWYFTKEEVQKYMERLGKHV